MSNISSPNVEGGTLGYQNGVLFSSDEPHWINISTKIAILVQIVVPWFSCASIDNGIDIIFYGHTVENGIVYDQTSSIV